MPAAFKTPVGIPTPLPLSRKIRYRIRYRPERTSAHLGGRKRPQGPLPSMSALQGSRLENRYPSLGGSRVQIPPPPLNQAESRSTSAIAASSRGDRRPCRHPSKTARIRLIQGATGAQLARAEGGRVECPASSRLSTGGRPSQA